MKSIWKFEIPIDLDTDNRCLVIMPKGADILCAKLIKSGAGMGEGIFVWAMVDTEAVKVPRYFVIEGTGWDSGSLCDDNYDYVDTVVEEQPGGPPFIWHIFVDSEEDIELPL